MDVDNNSYKRRRRENKAHKERRKHDDEAASSRPAGSFDADSCERNLNFDLSSAVIARRTQENTRLRQENERQKDGESSPFQEPAEALREMKEGSVGPSATASQAAVKDLPDSVNGGGGQGGFIIQDSTVAESETKQRRTHRRRLFVTLVATATALVLGAVSIVLLIDPFSADWDDINWGSGKVHRWIGWGAVVIGSFLVIYWIVRAIFVVFLPRLLSESFWYWVTGLQASVVGFAWSVVNWSVLPSLMPSVVSLAESSNCTTFSQQTALSALPSGNNFESVFVQWLHLIFLVVIIVSVMRVIKVLLAKYFVTKIHQGAFWESIQDALSMERMLKVFGIHEAGAAIDDDEVERAQKNENAATFWQGVDTILRKPRVAAKQVSAQEAAPDVSLLAYRLRQQSAVPSFAELEALDSTLQKDAESVATRLWRKCEVELPFDPSVESPSCAAGRMLSQDTVLTFKKFYRALQKPNRRVKLPNDDDAMKRQVISWWSQLDLSAHAGPFLAKTTVANDTDSSILEKYAHSPMTSPLEHGMSFAELISVLKLMFTRRESLYNTLHDREDISKLLNRTMDVIFWLLVTFIVPIVIGIDIAELILPLGTFVLGLGFVFGNSLKMVWECVLFLFLTRPFNIGDRITVGIDGRYPSMFVRKIGLLEVELQAVDGRLILFPTHDLRSSVIIQHARSVYYVCNLKLIVSYFTSADQLGLMAQRVKEWAARDREQRGVPWIASSLLMWVNSANQREGTMSIGLWLELRGITWNTPMYFLPLETDLWSAWLKITTELGIKFEFPLQPVALQEQQQQQRQQSDLDLAPHFVGKSRDHSDSDHGAIVEEAERDSINSMSLDDEGSSASSAAVSEAESGRRGRRKL